MLKINRDNQSFSVLDTPTLADVSITERYDLQEYICNSPKAFFNEIGQEFFLIGKEISPSKNVPDRIDLLAVDKEGTGVIIELKRGNHKLHMMQAISYAGMISQWSSDEFLQRLNDAQQEKLIEFLEVDDILSIASSFFPQRDKRECRCDERMLRIPISPHAPGKAMRSLAMSNGAFDCDCGACQES